MNKSILALCAFIPACAFAARAGYPVSFRCDFNNGIPQSIRLVDNDGNEPSPDVVPYGFATGKPWTDVRTDEAHVRSAASTSWYKSPAASDDWMILPKVSITSPAVTLSWEARAHDNVLSDGYEIYVSDGGDDIADFQKLTPVFTCPGEKVEWTSHTVSLADYEGKDVSIAFVNNSTDKALLYIDNIAVEEHKPLSATGFVPALLPVGEKLALSGTISNNTDTDLTGVTVALAIGGQNYANSDEALNIPAGKSASFSLPTGFQSEKMESYPYTLTVTSGGCTVTENGVLLSARQNVLMEEGTGTWCMWCPKGAVAMERLKAKYPDTFIPVAVHVNDPMTVEGYSVYAGTSGYPVCVANRMDKLRGNPDNIESYYQTAAGKDACAGIVSSGSYDNVSNTISAHTDLVFAQEYSDASFALQYIVTENDVHSDEPTYSQKNAFSGGTVEMGGFESLPDPVPAQLMWYQEVARALEGGEAGIEGSVPAYISAGEVISHDYSFTLGDNIMNRDKLQVITAVIDTKTGEVINSAYADISGLSSVTAPASGGNTRIVADGTTLRVVSDSDIESLTLISTDGSIVADRSHQDSIDISGAGHGVYIIRVKANGKYHYFKRFINN